MTKEVTLQRVQLIIALLLSLSTVISILIAVGGVLRLTDAVEIINILTNSLSPYPVFGFSFAIISSFTYLIIFEIYRRLQEEVSEETVAYDKIRIKKVREAPEGSEVVLENREGEEVEVVLENREGE